MTTISLPTGHAVIAAVAISRGLWLVPVMISLGPFYMGWAFLACNSVQHIGMHHGDETGANPQLFKPHHSLAICAQATFWILSFCSGPLDCLTPTDGTTLWPSLGVEGA